jgi:acetyl esterase/lipase
MVARAVYTYTIYGPPKKSWDIKTFLIVYILRNILGRSSNNVIESRERMKRLSAKKVKNSINEAFILEDKFRQRAHDLVRDHLIKVYGDGDWYGPESHWSSSPPLEPEWIIPNGLTRSSKSNVIVYIHGGGYTFGHFSKYRTCLERLAQSTGSIVLGANYRLAPDYSAPCQLEDVLAHILYLTSPVEDSGIGLSLNQIIVSGDSAGGGLSSILNHFMRDANIGKLAGVILYSPWIDLKTIHPCDSECSSTDYLPSLSNPTLARDYDGELIPGNFKNIIKGHSRPIQDRMLERGHHFAPVKYLNSPLISPLCDTNFSDLSPILIISGEAELVRDDSYLYHELINSSYSDEELDSFQIPPSTLHFYEDMFHVFHMVLPELPSSIISIKRAANFANQCFSKNPNTFTKM